MTYSFLPKFLDPSQEWGITEPNENEISHGRVSWQTDWTYFVMGTLASSTYRLTRVVHDLRRGARHKRLPHLHRQIVNNSAAATMLSVDKSPALILFPLLGNTHRPVTNIHRKQFQDCCNQSFERDPVRSRSTNEFSFADAYFNASTIRLSQNGSNACAPKKGRSTQKESKLL